MLCVKVSPYAEWAELHTCQYIVQGEAATVVHGELLTHYVDYSVMRCNRFCEIVTSDGVVCFGQLVKSAKEVSDPHGQL